MGFFRQHYFAYGILIRRYAAIRFQNSRKSSQREINVMDKEIKQDKVENDRTKRNLGNKFAEERRYNSFS